MPKQHLITEQEYIHEVMRTYAGSPDDLSKLTLGALGLAGESGEVIDMIKKRLFQGHEIDQDKLLDELGDVLWYFMLICHTMGYSLEEVMSRNVEKLRRRYPSGFTVSDSIHRSEQQENTIVAMTHVALVALHDHIDATLAPSYEAALDELRQRAALWEWEIDPEHPVERATATLEQLSQLYAHEGDETTCWVHIAELLVPCTVVCYS